MGRKPGPRGAVLGAATFKISAVVHNSSRRGPGETAEQPRLLGGVETSGNERNQTMCRVHCHIVLQSGLYSWEENVR